MLAGGRGGEKAVREGHVGPPLPGKPHWPRRLGRCSMAAAALTEAVSSSGGSLDGSGGSGGSNSSSSRHEKSLGLLTTKFVSLLQEAKDGVLDLKAVSGGRAGEGGEAGKGNQGV